MTDFDPAAESAATSPEEISSDEMRTSMSDIINRVAYSKDRIVVTRHGRPIVAVVPLDVLETVRNLEGLAAARAALADEDPGTPLSELDLDDQSKAMHASDR